MNLLDANDSVGEYPRSWYVASANKAPQVSVLANDIRADICIVGAGFSGISAALHLAQMGKSVCVLEAHRIGWGASGRNGGQLGSGQRLDQVELENILGRPKAKGLWQLAQDSKALARELIEKHAIKCAIKPGIAHTNHRKRFNGHSKEEVRLLNDEYGYEDIRYLDQDACRELVGSPKYYGGTFDRGSAHLHPLNYVLGLAHAAKKAGAQLFERSRVVQIEHGKKITVVTAQGNVVADNLILACNGYLGNLSPSVAKRVMPINNFIVATKPLDAQLADLVLKQDIAVADSKFVVNYFRLSEDRRLLFGGRESYGYRFPKDICEFVRKPMVEIFPQLADTSLEFGWGGTLAITMNRLPHFATLAKNAYSISGYSGHGVGMATLAGKLVAEKILGNGESFEQFRSLDAHKFPGGPKLRSPLLVLAMLYHSMLDKF